MRGWLECQKEGKGWPGVANKEGMAGVPIGDLLGLSLSKTGSRALLSSGKNRKKPSSQVSTFANLSSYHCSIGLPEIAQVSGGGPNIIGPPKS